MQETGPEVELSRRRVLRLRRRNTKAELTGTQGNGGNHKKNMDMNYWLVVDWRSVVGWRSAQSLGDGCVVGWWRVVLDVWWDGVLDR